MRKNGVSKANKVLLVILIILFVIAAALFVITDPFDIFHLGLMEKIFPSAGVGMDHITAGSENPAGVSAPGTPQPMKTPTAAPECKHKKAYVSYQEPATCTSGGYRIYYCPDCGDERSEYIPMDSNNHTGYSYTTGSRDATCTEKGYSGDKLCSNCGNIIEYGHDTPTTGHKAGPWVEVKAPTTSQQGRNERCCLKCGKVLYTEYSTRVPTSTPRRTATPKPTPKVTAVPQTSVRKKVFICTKSVKLRSQPGGGSQYGTADYGEMFDYVRTIRNGNDGDPWFEVKYGNGTAYIAGGTVGSQFWNLRRSCEINYYSSAKKLKITGSTYLVKNPDQYAGDNKKDAISASRGDNYQCFGEVVDELFPSRVWYLVKYSGNWYFVPKNSASVN